MMRYDIKILPLLYFKLVCGSLDFKSMFSFDVVCSFVEQVFGMRILICHQTTELFSIASQEVIRLNYTLTLFFLSI